MRGIALHLAIATSYLAAVALGDTTIYIGPGNDGAASTSRGSSPDSGGPGALMPAILLALEQGAPGANTLLAWSGWAEDIVASHRTPPPVWVICTDTAGADLVLETPHAIPFLVVDESSWADVLESFISRSPSLWGVGLFGEGTLPHPGLMDSIESMQLALFETLPPTAILTRSRSGEGLLEEGRWLPDSFVSQLWCNRAALEASIVVSETGLDNISAREVTLLQVLPRLIRDAVGKKSLVLVDGTHVIGSMWKAPLAPDGSDSGGDKYSSTSLQLRQNQGAGRAKVYIGNLGVALVYDTGDVALGKLTRGDIARGKEWNEATIMIKTSSIVEAPWPPQYILETVAMNTTAAASKGLVLVSNVNCGYLDMATNFLFSVRNTSDAKVLFVAMDEVSFDFMDALEPGCAALIPSTSTERQHSIESGQIGDSRFAEAVLVRPRLLRSVLKQGYAALWSDADMVWLANPLPLLPQLADTAGAEVMLQYDGNSGNKCTCFMFLKPTMMSRMLLKLWEQAIIDGHKIINQQALQQPLSYMRHSGLRVDILPAEVMPAGKHFFDHGYEHNYVQLYHEHARIVHNNWIKGHKAKEERFRRYDLWFVGHMSFPVCGSTTRGGGRRKVRS